jgi:hypothetical protein
VVLTGVDQLEVVVDGNRGATEMNIGSDDVERTGAGHRFEVTNIELEMVTVGEHSVGVEQVEPGIAARGKPQPVVVLRRLVDHPICQREVSG